MLFEVGIPNLMCGYTLGSWSVPYYFGNTVTLTSDRNSRKNCVHSISDTISGMDAKFGVWIHLRVTNCLRVTVILSSGLNSRKSCLWGIG